MIAKYNVKVNGRWYSAGTDIPEGKRTVKRVVEQNPEETEPEEAEQKPKTAGRRKVSK